MLFVNPEDDLLGSGSKPTEFVRNVGQLAAFPFASENLPRTFGRYELTAVLGVGGMGSVYLATDSVLRRQVALKIPHAASDRFIAEARAAAKIRHPNICTVHDIGCIKDHPFLTMEFIDGPSLETCCAGQSMQPIFSADMVMRIAAAVHAAHQQGVIHRDLKPANILMRNGKQPVVTDFGLAHQVGLQGGGAAKLLGSPSYMSPEQVRSETEIGPATDVYGLGAILFELLTGSRLFQGNVMSIYAQILTRPAPLPSELVPGLDRRLDLICKRALAKRACDRYPDMFSFSRDLVQYIQEPAPPVTPKTTNLRIAPPTAKTSAQAVYSKDAAAIRSFPSRQGRLLSARTAICRARWKSSRQIPGIVAGVLLGGVVATSLLLAFNALTSQETKEPTATPTSVVETTVETKPTGLIPVSTIPVSTIIPDVPQTPPTEQSFSPPPVTESHSVETPALAKTMVHFQLPDEFEMHDFVATLDGERISPQQLADPVAVEPGVHELKVVSHETKPFTCSFHTSAETSELEVELPLERRVGKLRIRILRLLPTDRVLIDRQRIPMKKLTQPLMLPVGEHALEVFRDDLPFKRKTFWVIAGNNPDLAITTATKLSLDRTTAELLSINHLQAAEFEELPLKPGEIRAANRLGIQFAWCPVPTHKSTPNHIKGFWMARYEISNAQWKMLQPAAPWESGEASSSHLHRHVRSLTKDEAAEFASQLTEIERQRASIDENWEFALPTAEQWELAMDAAGATKPLGKLPPGFNAWGVFKRRGGIEWSANGLVGTPEIQLDDAAPQQVGFRLVLKRTDPK